MTLDEAIKALADCYRASGADTDGMEDWRLASHAAQEVETLRRDYEEACLEASDLRDALVEAVRVLEAIRDEGHRIYPLERRVITQAHKALSRKREEAA